MAFLVPLIRQQIHREPVNEKTHRDLVLGMSFIMEYMSHMAFDSIRVSFDMATLGCHLFVFYTHFHNTNTSEINRVSCVASDVMNT